MNKYAKDELMVHLATEAEKLVLGDKGNKRVLEIQVTDLRDLMIVNGYVTLAGISERIESKSDGLMRYEAELDPGLKMKIFRNMSLEEMSVILIGYLG